MNTKTIGILPKGPRNAITDVSGVTVGHTTIHDRDIHSGVTVIMPAQNDLFQNKLTAACPDRKENTLFI